MRSLIKSVSSPTSNAEAFDHLRKVYPERRDFTGTAVAKGSLNMSQEVKGRIASLGFLV